MEGSPFSRRLHIAGVLSATVLALLGGCSAPELPRFQRRPLTLNDIVVRVAETPRGYLLSDRTGGFLLGEARRDAAFPRDQWTVWGKVIAQQVRVTLDGAELRGPCDSIFVAPDRIDRWFPGGIHASTTIVAFPVAGTMTHALRVSVSGAAGRAVGAALLGGSDRSFVAVAPTAETSDGDTLTGVQAPATSVLFLARAPLPSVADRIRLVRLAMARTDEVRLHLQGILEDAYLRVSDDRLTRAAAWARLTLDALTVRGADTLIVSGLPWKGTWSGRDNAQALSGLTALSGPGLDPAAIVRALARRQDTVAASPTYGRIANEFGPGWARFDGADVAPSLIRGMYEAVAVTNDTTLVRGCWPVIERSIAGVRRDTSNFLLHGPGETWMEGLDRGSCAAELQLLWHFEQLIGSYVASFVGDTLAASKLRLAGIRTFDEFNARFVDTTTYTVFDHLDRHGRGVHRNRPNTLMCLEAVGQSITTRNIVHSAAESLVRPWGVGTLAPGAEGYFPGPDAGGGHAYDGAVWTWLTGPLVYGLTRFDAQDVAFPVTQNHAGRMLDRGVVGSLPEMLRATAGGKDGEDAGRVCSATGLAEFSRTLIQDYLGVRIDASAGELSVQPKLPRGITSADLTVRVSGEPVDVRFEAATTPARLVITRHRGVDTLRVRVVWMLPTGDAWRGRVDVAPDREVTLVIGEDEIFAQEGSERVPVVNPVKIRKFSRRAEFGDVWPVRP